MIIKMKTILAVIVIIAVCKNWASCVLYAEIKLVIEIVS